MLNSGPVGDATPRRQRPIRHQNRQPVVTVLVTIGSARLCRKMTVLDCQPLVVLTPTLTPKQMKQAGAQRKARSTD